MYRLNFSLPSYYSVRLWSVQSSTSLVEYKGHDNPVWDIAVAPRGAYFASASLDRTVRLWHTEYAFPLRIFAGHNDSVDVSNMSFWIQAPSPPDVNPHFLLT